MSGCCCLVFGWTSSSFLLLLLPPLTGCYDNTLHPDDEQYGGRKSRAYFILRCMSLRCSISVCNSNRQQQWKRQIFVPSNKTNPPRKYHQRLGAHSTDAHWQPSFLPSHTKLYWKRNCRLYLSRVERSQPPCFCFFVSSVPSKPSVLFSLLFRVGPLLIPSLQLLVLFAELCVQRSQI